MSARTSVSSEEENCRATLDPFAYLSAGSRLIVRSELLQEVATHGRELSDRTLTFYGSKGLIPAPIRRGRGPGQYPEAIVDLVCWLIDQRSAGTPLPALGQLVELWQLLATSSGVIAQETVQTTVDGLTHPAALLAAPWVIAHHGSRLTWLDSIGRPLDRAAIKFRPPSTHRR